MIGLGGAVGAALVGSAIIGALDLARAVDESRAPVPVNRMGGRTLQTKPRARANAGGRHGRKG